MPMHLQDGLGQTPLFVAAACGRQPVVLFLLAKCGADPEVGSFFLPRVAEPKLIERLCLLINCGANPEVGSLFLLDIFN